MKIVCRCQDVTEEEVVAAIRQGATTIDEIKRLVRVGMGHCQGRTCRRLVMQILSRELGKPFAAIDLPTQRPPTRPLPFDLITAEATAHGVHARPESAAPAGAAGRARAKPAASRTGKVAATTTEGRERPVAPRATAGKPAAKAPAKGGKTR